jgi:hypothetical protein
MATAAEREDITMEDGKVVSFTVKTGSKAQKVIKEVTKGDDGAVTVRFNYRSGDVRVVTLHPSDPCFLDAVAEGISNKLSTAYNSEPDAGDALFAFDEALDKIRKGEWSRAAGEGGSVKGLSILAKAIMEVKGVTAEVAREKLSGISQAEKLALRKVPAIAAVIEKLEAKSKKADAIDTGALLSLFDENNDETGDETVAKKSKAA